MKRVEELVSERERGTKRCREGGGAAESYSAQFTLASNMQCSGNSSIYMNSPLKPAAAVVGALK